nr:MAG TPA: hypothetical protein [Caudoviricetes sp.]
MWGLLKLSVKKVKISYFTFFTLTIYNGLTL